MVKRNIWEFCEKIALQPEIVKKLRETADDTLIEKQRVLIDGLTYPETAPYSYEQLLKQYGDSKDNISLMYCYLSAALLTHDRYKERNIPDEIYFDTMKAFSRFVSEGYEMTGEFSFTKAHWIWRHISMCLFRVGELEYEFRTSRGENVIAFHIPSDADLRREAVGQSIEQAKAFMQTYFPKRAKDRYLCHSWIMSPKLKNLLKSGSNILQFQQRFELIETTDLDKVEIPFIFKMPKDTPYHELKEETSLQKKVKEMLLNGEGIGLGYAILKEDGYMKENIIKKIKNNINQMGSDLLEFRGKPDGKYFVNRDKCISLKHIFCWTQSFFTGMAYWAYVESKDPGILKWLYGFKQEYADKVFRTPLENMHDVGFLYLPYAVALYKLTGDEDMKAMGIKAADELAKRFEPRGGYIRAWGRMDYQIPEYVDSELAKDHFFTESRGVAIVDCMMNIPLLFWAEEVTGNKFYGRVAEVHADTTAKYFIREDDSVCHAYRFDEETGEPIKEESYCGYGIGSYWARGTAWAIYGYACCYAYTGKQKYLEISLRLFERFVKESKGEVPVWDFRTPEGENANLDASAAVIVLCACNKLEKYTDHAGVRQYLDTMYDKLLPYIDLSLENNGLLKEQNGKHLYSSYGDYYLVEALFMREHPEYVLW